MKGKLSFLVAGVVLLGACSNLATLVPDVDPLAGVEVAAVGDWSAVTRDMSGLEGFSWVDGERFVINTADGERNFVAGVNLGVTIPGAYPGDLAVSAETYRSWFDQIGDFGFRSIRIYTMLPPHFYEQLRAYNLANPQRPLYLIHGAWPPEDELLAAGNFYDPNVLAGFRQELADLVDVVHGSAVIGQRPGRAWGTFTADVSPWMLAWSIGIEWDPATVITSDELNADAEPFVGEFFVASDMATPTESWLASLLDAVATKEASYGKTMPLSFVNWITTDPLSHPDEADNIEDAVSVDPMHIAATAAWPGGYFAGYHVYPYYPEFQRFEAGIVDFERDGEPDAYAGMLDKLASHHTGIPLMVLEFGVPSSLGSSHSGPQGRDQGNHSEQDQAAINAEMFRIIEETGLSGGYLFEWSDEWFKVTWNTAGLEESDRRSIWMNPLNPETHFGVIALEPGSEQQIVVDGDDEDWAEQGQVLVESEAAIRELRVTHDEGYLYLKIVTDDKEPWRDSPIVVGFDSLTGVSGGLPHTDGFFPESDYAVVFDGSGASLQVRASADHLLLQYASRGYVIPGPGELDEGNRQWNVFSQLIGRPLVIPTTGEQTQVEIARTGELRHGTTDPNERGFDSRNTWFGDGHTIEARIPWQALGFSDPSQQRVYEIDHSGAISYSAINRLGIAVGLADHQTVTAGYAWRKWSVPQYHERLKAGTGELSEAVIGLNSQ